MDTDESKVEVWIRKKPKRIIQNQTFIVLVSILAGVSPLILSGGVFWFVFSLHSPVVIPAIIISWFISSVTYIALRLASRILSAKEKSS